MRVRKDGSQFLAQVTLTALRDVSGKLRGYSEVSHDLTEAEEAGAKYRGLLEAAPDALVIVGEKGEIVLLNSLAETQFGYKRNELLGQKVTAIIPRGFAEQLIADRTSAADAPAQQIGMGLELSGRRKDGSEFPIEIMLSPLDTPRGISGDRRNPRHQRAQRRGTTAGTNGGTLSWASGSGSGRHGGGQPGRRNCPSECSGGEAVRVHPTRTHRTKSHGDHTRWLCGTNRNRCSSIHGRCAVPTDRYRN